MASLVRSWGQPVPILYPPPPSTFPKGEGCPPEFQLPPSPRFSVFINRPPPPLFCTKQGATPPCFQSQKVCFVWSVRRAGGIPHPSAKEQGGWGYPPHHQNGGYPLPPVHYFSYRAPTPPRFRKRRGNHPPSPPGFYITVFPVVPETIPVMPAVALLQGAVPRADYVPGRLTRKTPRKPGVSTGWQKWKRPNTAKAG